MSRSENSLPWQLMSDAVMAIMRSDTYILTCTDITSFHFVMRNRVKITRPSQPREREREIFHPFLAGPSQGECRPTGI